MTACHPERKKFAEAEQLAADGKYDDAITAYKDVLNTWPDSPEAKKTGEARGRVLAQKVKHLYLAGKYGAAARAYAELYSMAGRVAAPGVHFKDWGDRGTQQASLWLDDDIEPGMECVMDLANSRLVKTDDAGQMAAVFRMLTRDLSERHGDMPESLAKEMSSFLCESRTDFPSYKTCANVDSDIEGVAAKDAVSRLDKAKASCTTISQLGPVCGDEVTAELAALAGKIATLTAAIVDQEPVWKSQLRDEWKIPLSSLTELAKACEKTKRETRQIIQKGLRTDRETAEFYWRGVGTGSISPDSPIPKMVRDFQLEFAKNSLALGNSMKSDDWSDECNQALDDAVNKIFINCVQDGAPADVNWIRGIMPDECPYPPLAASIEVNQ